MLPSPDTGRGIPPSVPIKRGSSILRAQLGGGARPAGPPCLFLPRERRALELVVEVDLLVQDDVRTLREFLGHERAGHLQGLLPFPALIPGPDLGEVLDRPDRGMTEGELEERFPSLLPERCRVRWAEFAAPGTRRQ